jgi:hypothetical protein
MRTVSLIALACGLLAGCANSSTSVQSLQEVDIFRSNLSVGMTRLRAQYSKLEPQAVDRNTKCRRLIFDLLGISEGDSEDQALSNAFASLLARSQTFNMYDRNVMWLTGELLKDHPPGDPAFLMALGEKIENSRSDQTPPIYKTTYSALAAGFILNRVSYEGMVDTHNDQVDYEEFSLLYAWLIANGDKLVYDAETGLYTPQEPPAPEPQPEQPEAVEEAQPDEEAVDEPEDEPVDPVEEPTEEPAEVPAEESDDDAIPPTRPDPPAFDEMTVEFE